MKQKNTVHGRITKMLELGENSNEVMPISTGIGIWITVVPRVSRSLEVESESLMRADFSSRFDATLEELEKSVKIGLHGALGFCVDRLPYTHQMDITVGYPYFTLPQHSIKTSIQKIISIWELAKNSDSKKSAKFYYILDCGTILSHAVENNGKYFYALFGDCRDKAHFISEQLRDDFFDSKIDDSLLVTTIPVLKSIGDEDFKKLNLSKSKISVQEDLNDLFWASASEFIGRKNDL